jgi:hypothetical protein
MMDKKQVQAAIGRIDGILGKARFTEPIFNREDHIVLVNDIKLVQSICEQYFIGLTACKSCEEPEDGGTDECPEHVGPGDEDIEGGGDSV